MGSKTTTTIDETRTITPDPPSPQELALLEQQANIAAAVSRNIDLTSSAFQQQLRSIQPLLDLAAEEARIRGQVLTPEIQTQIVQNEIALQQANVELLRTQLETQAALDPQRRTFIESQLQAAQLDLERAQSLDPLREETLRQQFDIIQRGGVPTEAQREFFGTAAGEAIAAGRSDIEMFAAEQVRLLGQELAPSLGLRPSDSPILDRGQLVAREATRQFGQLQSAVRGQEAQALSGLIGQNLATAGALTGLELSLADQAQRNRIALATALAPTGGPTPTGAVLGQPGQAVGQALQFGLGAANIQTGIPQTIGSLLGFRAGTATQQFTGTTVEETQDPFGSIIAGIGAAGGLLTGLGAVGVGGSDARIKKNVKDLTVLDKLNDIHGVTFEYLDSDIPKIGVIAQDLQKDFPEAVIEVDGILMVDYSMLAAIALQGVKELKEQLDG